MTDTTQTTDLPEDTGQVMNIDQLAYLIGQWFQNAHAQAHQLLEVPEGQSLSVAFEVGAEAEELILTGDAMKGFKAGIIVLTNIFGELPFGAVPVASNDQPASGN